MARDFVTAHLFLLSELSGLLVIVAVVIAAVAIARFDRISLEEAMYLTLITAFTVGFGDVRAQISRRTGSVRRPRLPGPGPDRGPGCRRGPRARHRPGESRGLTISLCGAKLRRPHTIRRDSSRVRQSSRRSRLPPDGRIIR
jgi:hypothetical protein